MLSLVAARRGLMSRRTLRLWLVMLFVALGVVSAVAALVDVSFRDPFKPHGDLYLAAEVVVCVVFATIKVLPRSSVVHYFSIPGTEVAVLVGDLFDQPGHLVIGMS